MLYLCTGLAYAYTTAFTPGVNAPGALLQPARAAMLAASRAVPAMMAGGTETMDYDSGTILNDRELLDADLLQQGRRSRPNIDWSNLRARLEITFGLTDEELKKYDEISDTDLVAAYAARPRRSEHSARARKYIWRRPRCWQVVVCCCC